MQDDVLASLDVKTAFDVAKSGFFFADVLMGGFLRLCWRTVRIEVGCSASSLGC